jgi:hypothetical protein
MRFDEAGDIGRESQVRERTGAVGISRRHFAEVEKPGGAASTFVVPASRWVGV